MSRFLALVLALLLPLQLAWGAAAAHCQHESDPHAAQHFGHHEHFHKATAEKPSDGKVQIDSDCSFCNSTVSHAMTLAKTTFPEPLLGAHLVELGPLTVSSAPARAPDRPQWTHLA